jgi:DNA-binding NarL/FixJ family response regulator
VQFHRDADPAMQVIRQVIARLGTSMDRLQPRNRVTGRDGKTYPRRSNPALPVEISKLRESGCTIREIARRLNCSVGTVHHYLKRG